MNENVKEFRAPPLENVITRAIGESALVLDGWTVVHENRAAVPDADPSAIRQSYLEQVQNAELPLFSKN